MTKHTSLLLGLVLQVIILVHVDLLLRQGTPPAGYLLRAAGRSRRARRRRCFLWGRVPQRLLPQRRAQIRGQAGVACARSQTPATGSSSCYPLLVCSRTTLQ